MCKQSRHCYTVQFIHIGRLYTMVCEYLSLSSDSSHQQWSLTCPAFEECDRIRQCRKSFLCKNTPRQESVPPCRDSSIIVLGELQYSSITHILLRLTVTIPATMPPTRGRRPSAIKAPCPGCPVSPAMVTAPRYVHPVSNLIL